MKNLYKEVRMESKDRAGQIGSIIFYIALVIELGIVIVDKSAYINPIEGRLFQLTFLLCMLKIVMTKYSLKEWMVMTAFFALGAVSYFATGRNEIIRIAAFIAASKDMELSKIMRVIFYATLMGVIILVGLSFTGILGSIFYEADFRGMGIERRYCFGLGHPNALHCMVWALTVLGIYLYWERLKWYHFIILEIANIALYMLTVSRTSMAVMTVSVFAAAILNIFPKLQKKTWIYLLSALGVAGCIVFSIAFVQYSMNEIAIIDWIDKCVTGRITWAYFDGRPELWSMFSNPDNSLYFDMGYIRLFYWYGIIPGIIYVIVKGLQILYCFRKKDAADLLVITMFAIYTVFEAHAVSVYIARDYALMLMAGTWSDIFMARSECEGYLWQPGRYLKRQS